MTLPPPDDPRWRDIVAGTTDYPLKGLATQLILTRVRLQCWRPSEAKLQAAILELHEYFERNAAAAHTKDDLQSLFG